jgi:Concanavalin A-like lectin/glucanases superfamily
MSLVSSRLQLTPRPLDPGGTDTYTHAYSTRRVRSTYAGPCLRVRRSSDNTEQDIGFVAGQLDTTALLAFCGSADGYVAVWYSQLAGTDNATQAVREFQPRICSNGVVHTTGTSPALVFGDDTPQPLIPPSGWTVTASSIFSGTRGATQAFDRSSSTAWQSANSTYNLGPYIGSVSTTVDGATIFGEYLQISIPYAGIVTSLGYIRPGFDGTLRGTPASFILAASNNDGATWTALVTMTGLSANSFTPGVETRFEINAQTSYTLYRFIITSTTDVFTATAQELQLYGTFATPLPKVVSLIPPMSGDTHGGYLASASSVLSTGYPASLAFDASVSTFWHSAVTYTNGGYTGAVSTTVAGLDEPVLGEWVQIQCPTPVALRQFGLVPRTGYTFRAPGIFTIVGSSDGVTWTLLGQYAAVQGDYADTIETPFSMSPVPAAFTSYRLIIMSVPGNTNGNSVQLAEWRLYGIEPPATFFDLPVVTTLPRAVGGGMAPLRDQRLVPPSGYTAAASSVYNTSFPVFYVFNRTVAAFLAWHSGSTYTVNSGAYAGAVTTTVAGVGDVAGEWFQIQLPGAARLTRYSLTPRLTYLSRCPSALMVVGSNDGGTTWNLVDAVTNIALSRYTDYQETLFSVGASSGRYSLYRLITQAIFSAGNGTAVNIGECVLYGVYDTPPPPQSLVPVMTDDAHGWYVASSSSVAQNNVNYLPWRAFNASNGTSWNSTLGIYPGGVYNGTVTTALTSGASAVGEYLQILLPDSVELTSYTLQARTSYPTRGPTSFTLAHSTDRGATWILVEQRTGLTWVDGVSQTFTLSQPLVTSALRLIVHAVVSDSAGVEEWVLTGYEFPTTASSSSASALLQAPASLFGETTLAAPPGSSLAEVLGMASSAPSDRLATRLRRLYDTRPTRATLASGIANSNRILRARLADLDSQVLGSAVATWGSYSQPNEANRPVYQLGTDGLPEVAFDRTLSHYMDGGTKTFRIGDNAGFTIVVHFKFTGVLTTYETIFDIGPSVGPGASWIPGIRIIRGIYSSISVAGGDIGGQTQIFSFRSSAIAQNVWTIVALRYKRVNSNGVVELYVNGVKDAEQSIGASTFANRTNTQTLIGRHNLNQTPQFNGSMRFAGMWDRALSDAELSSLYTSLVGSAGSVRSLTLTARPTSTALVASLSATARRALLEGRLARNVEDLVTLGAELARLGPAMASPVVSPTPLRLTGVTWPVVFDYVVLRGSVTISSGFAVADFFSSVADIRPAIVVVDGNLTIDASATFTPPVRKLFTVLYVTGNLTVNGTISMTARGANHSGTGSSGGYVEPQDIRILTGTRDGVTNPQIPATGGAGGENLKSYSSILAKRGQPGLNGGTGGGGSGGILFLAQTFNPGAGSAGTAFSGGTGGGASEGSADAQAGESNGGAGGAGAGTWSTFTGAGNPAGGTGGTMIIVVNGIVSGNGSIESNGSKGVGYSGDSGGGSITVLAHSGGDIVKLQAAGNLYYRDRGAPGGDGSARLLRVLAGPAVSARVRDLSTLAAGAVVSTWGSWAATSQPVYALGADATYEVQFDRSVPHYMDSGTATYNIFTNAGFTMVVFFKFTGTAVTNEPILVNGTVLNAYSNQLSLIRGPVQSLRVLAGDGGLYHLNFSGGTVPQDTWVVAAVRYLRVDGVGYGQLFINNVKVAEQNIGATTFANRTSKTYLGADVATPPTADQEFHGSMRFAAMWDRALSDQELTALHTSLTT